MVGKENADISELDVFIKCKARNCLILALHLKQSKMWTCSHIPVDGLSNISHLSYKKMTLVLLCLADTI